MIKTKARIKKILTGAAVVLLVTIGLNIGLQAPASAAPYCPNGYVCVYEHTGGRGNSTWLSYSYGTCINLSDWWNDKASSVRNGMPFYVQLHEHSGCTGRAVGLGAECGGCLSSYVNDLGGWPYFFNDRASSVRFY